MNGNRGEPIVGAGEAAEDAAQDQAGQSDDEAEAADRAANEGNGGSNPPPPPPPPPTPPPPPVPGPYKIATADSNGKALDPPDRFNPAAEEAVLIYFGLVGPTPTPEQADLQDQISQVLTTAKKLYLEDGGNQKEPFRLLYTKLFRLAQIGLEGDNPKPDVARLTLAREIDDLICSEGPRIKNAHLRRLGRWAALMSSIFLVLYVLLSVAEEVAVFPLLGIAPAVARSFMILWVGTFLGVWLSYAIRKAEFQLRDLTVAEADLLEPAIRLVFSGLLANIVALFLLLGMIEVRIGSMELDSFARDPVIALLLGMVLGLNELLLPASIARKSRDAMAKMP